MSLVLSSGKSESELNDILSSKMLSQESATEIDNVIFVGHRSDPNRSDVKGYLDLYSPRVAAAFDHDMLKDQTSVLYVCAPRIFENEIEFMLSCKAKRTNSNFYMFDSTCTTPIEAKKNFDRSRHTLYNIVSGDNIPDNMSQDTFKMVFRYMSEGVYVFLLMSKRGVGDFDSGAEEGRAYTKSKLPHSFQKGDDVAMNVSNVFMGMLIDYYRISSGSQGVDSQVSFMRNEQYRITVYVHMRDVFNAFLRNNNPAMRNETRIFDGKELASMVMEILVARLFAD